MPYLFNTESIPRTSTAIHDFHDMATLDIEPVLMIIELESNTASKLH